MINKKIIAILVSLLAALIISGCSGDDATDQSDAAAIVNGEAISKTDLEESIEQIKSMYAMQGIPAESFEDEEMSGLLQESALDQLINTKLLTQAADEGGYESSEEEVTEQIEQIKGQFETEEELNEALEANQLTLEKLEEQLAEEMKISRYIEENIPEVTVAEDEIKSTYDEYSQQMDDLPPYEDIKAQLEQELIVQKQQEEVTKLIEKLKEESEIEILV